MRIFGSCLMIAETAENPGDLTYSQLLRIEEKSLTGEGNSLMREIKNKKQTF